MSAEGLPFTVVFPFLVGCLYWRWLVPLCRYKYQPSWVNRLIISLTFTTFIMYFIAPISNNGNPAGEAIPDVLDTSGWHNQKHRNS